MKAVLKHKIFELRFKANPIILDNKGLISQILLNGFNLEEFEIRNDGCSIKMKDKSFNAFILLNRLGLSLSGNFSPKDFTDKTLRLLDSFESIPFIEESLYVERLGIRIRYFYKSDLAFDELTKLYTGNFISIPQTTLDAFNVTLKDVACPLTFTDDSTTIKFNCGPMEKDQIIDTFTNYPDDTSSFPKIGNYIDIDYSYVPHKELSFSDIKNKILEYSKQTEIKSETVINLILGIDNEQK